MIDKALLSLLLNAKSTEMDPVLRNLTDRALRDGAKDVQNTALEDYKLKQVDKAIRLVEIGLMLNNNIRKKNADDYSQQLFFFSFQGTIYSSLENTNDNRLKAINALEKALLVAPEIQEKEKTDTDLCTIVSCLNLLGKHYVSSGRCLDAAIDKFQEALECCNLISKKVVAKPLMLVRLNENLKQVQAAKQAALPQMSTVPQEDDPIAEEETSNGMNLVGHALGVKPKGKRVRTIESSSYPLGKFSRFHQPQKDSRALLPRNSQDFELDPPLERPVNGR